tara:strand:+ start:2467 stop:2592 length:126 start_codon:yes stop_codon:yes gene_type:complete
MIVLKDKYEGKIIHSLNELGQEYIDLLKNNTDFIEKYFIEK